MVVVKKFNVINLPNSYIKRCEKLDECPSYVKDGTVLFEDYLAYLASNRARYAIKPNDAFVNALIECIESYQPYCK